MTGVLTVHDEVRDALASGRAVVALESTIVTHGMPYPANVETARRVDAEVRDHGATPATIAVMNGQLRVGLADAELETLASSDDALKVSRRDLAFAVHERAIGGTTVAATMVIARMAGITVFATGGIGGVHRGASASFDISADLLELARTDVTVVSAGFKSILDLGLTLEYLETQGVPVIGYGTDVLPAFYTRDSEFGLDHRVDAAADVATLVALRRQMKLGGGVVVANPIPMEHALEPAVIDAAIAQAIDEAEGAGIHGKAVTPYLLERIADITGRASLDANVALVLNNARVAAQVACAEREQDA